MYAVIETGGKQYKVKEGSTIYVEKLDKQPSSKVEFDKVLLVAGEGKDPIIGNPYIKNGSVRGTLVDNIKDDKVVVFKFKRKTGYRRKKGHRQQLSQVKVEKIQTGGTEEKKTTKSKNTEDSKSTKKTQTKKTQTKTTKK